jgi:regulator of cell morphogenesis and NO signaling
MKHNRLEDEIIFPTSNKLTQPSGETSPMENCLSGTLRKPLHIVEQEHLRIQQLLYTLQSTTNYFTPPESACINYRVIYKKLEELNNNLTQHKHLENDLLFPKAIAIEQKLLQV